MKDSKVHCPACDENDYGGICRCGHKKSEDPPGGSWCTCIGEHCVKAREARSPRTHLAG